ncbi:MAG: hypothetical protein AAFP18_07905 [Bacteroidota bacterium]
MPTSRSSSKAPSTPALEDQERGPHWRTLLLPDAPAAAVRVGGAALHPSDDPVAGAFVERDGETWYHIAHVDKMRPFFMSLVSSSDHWTFVSSTGALTAGRRSPDFGLFPYVTVDKIHDARNTTGGVTLLRVAQGASGDGQPTWALWEPFSDRYAGLYRTRRSLYKSLHGDRLCFEEVNDDLGLTVATTWATSERYGFVRRTVLTHHGDAPVRVQVLDGLRNLMPYGVSRPMQSERSVLADAYKRNELDPASGLGMITLSAQPVDRAEPSESLMATTVWQAGLAPDLHLLSTRQLDAFRAGQALRPERDVRAERGAYFVHATLDLAPGDAQRWMLVADIEQDAADAVALIDQLSDPAALQQAVLNDVEAGTARLREFVAAADGLQASADRMIATRQFSNTLFNIMRGGVFDEGYRIYRVDLIAHVRTHHRPLADHAFLAALPDAITVQDLRALLDKQQDLDPDLERLCRQYLPLSFSRRHGDPSRPWNFFSIDLRAEDGTVKRGFQGNWRDLFQNWEALGRSFPAFGEGMVATFLNASTADGYNPYRISHNGIDWEVIEPDDEWSYIGYWGDHQLVYLLHLLELVHEHEPEQLTARLNERLFTYANVPYRICSYAELLADPRDTIDYDHDEHDRIEARVAAVGADGKLLYTGDAIARATLAEKLLVPLLAKLSNFVAGGGIWMNTQRPEWNDANNALVGYGISMVTLHELRRYLDLIQAIFADADGPVTLAEEVADFTDAVAAAFAGFDAEAPLTDATRKALLDQLGLAGEAYRSRLYTNGLSGATRTAEPAALLSFFDDVRETVDATLRDARREEDGLANAYNLLVIPSDGIDADGVGVKTLYPMLEGQVAALGAGVLDPEALLGVIEAMRTSDLYRPDQHTYRLYPDRDLPGFLAKNNVPNAAVAASPLLQQLLADGDTRFVVRDVRGGVHFNGTFRNRANAADALDVLAADYPDAVAAERDALIDLFDTHFDHPAYTGRSGTFFGYEGLGSIYWHMVSKLVVAAQRTFLRAHESGADAETLRKLAEGYHDLRGGLGLNKSPLEYGAFPTDPYSHSPGTGGAKQPGMTGMVKEDLIWRWGELGVFVEHGRLHFEPQLLRPDEFFDAPATFAYVDLDNTPQTLDVPAGAMAFTYAQVPVLYRRASTPRIELVRSETESQAFEGSALPADVSADVFDRTGTIARIVVDVVL